jgi:hypothetical protein
MLSLNQVKHEIKLFVFFTVYKLKMSVFSRGPTRLKSRTLDSEIKPEIKKSREKSVNFEIRNH